jgi:dienelactone hydrolase
MIMNNEKPGKKTWKKVLRVLILIPVIIGVVLAAMYFYTDNKKDIKAGYNLAIETGGALEAKYLAGGALETTKYTAKAEDPIKKYTVYYPAEMGSSDKTYPMILVMNGTGGKATRYEAQFELYASWGFIAVGTQDKGTGTGVTTVKALQYMLEQNENPDSVFYQKIDLDNIGITGFSQGGAGVLNVLTKYEEASYFKAAAPLSPVSEYMTAQVTDYTYDSSLVKIPIMILAGTEGDFETETVIPINLLNEQYDKITTPKVMARRIGMDHDHMMYSAGGYVIAWFRWQLMNDEEAAQAFIGESPELLTNTVYQDQRIDLD